MPDSCSSHILTKTQQLLCNLQFSWKSRAELIKSMTSAYISIQHQTQHDIQYFDIFISNLLIFDFWTLCVCKRDGSNSDLTDLLPSQFYVGVARCTPPVPSGKGCLACPSNHSTTNTEENMQRYTGKNECKLWAVCSKICWENAYNC